MMQVILTQHTEEDVWNYYYSKWEGIEHIHDIIRKAKNRLLDKVFDKNPYAENDWRKGKPKRINKLDWFNYLSEDEMEIFHALRDFQRDMNICNKSFKWNESKEINGILFDWEQLYATSSDTEEFELYENLRFNQSRAKWETDDAEWIADQKVISYHKANHRPRGWKEKHWKTMGEEERKWYERGIVDYEFHEDCKYCVSEAETTERRERELKEYEEKEERKLKESNEKWLREQEGKRKEQDERLSNREEHVCDVCNYKTLSDENYEVHLESKSHIANHNAKKWFCNCCEAQCRSQLEWTVHCGSRKHKINAGELPKVEEYSCQKCNYSTKLKQNFEKHLVTNGHMKLHKV
jgi:hypothetical protein